MGCVLESRDPADEEASQAPHSGFPTIASGCHPVSIEFEHHAKRKKGKRYDDVLYICFLHHDQVHFRSHHCTSHLEHVNRNLRITSKMVSVKAYELPPTLLIPNSPNPVLHYPRLLSVGDIEARLQAFDLFSQNGWQTQWIYRYGKTQASHYHSHTHECMVVLSGSATIRFGVADVVGDDSEVWDKEQGGVEVKAEVGDVFVIPSGVAHKTYSPSEDFPLKLLTPGNGHGIDAEDERSAVASVELSGFTMMGAYPKDGGQWDFLEGGDHDGEYEKVWSVPLPNCDPVLGTSKDGLCGRWK